MIKKKPNLTLIIFYLTFIFKYNIVVLNLYIARNSFLIIANFLILVDYFYCG